MPLSPATRLGSYEILGSLGAGGMGEVYRARDTRLRREVAIKVLPRDLATEPERLARFEREATTVAGLNHPNIVTLYSVEESDGARFLTMELVEGRDLSALVTPGGLPVMKVLELAIPILDALEAAHDKGVVHRDLKPGNVRVTPEGRVKVLDFGLAKSAGPDGDLDNTQAATMATPLSSAGQVVGTAPYMAPEQLRGEPVDARTDLFSFGILAYELATGKRPFAGPTFADLSSAILRDRPPSFASHRADLPAQLERVLGRCLEKRPRDRFQSALEVANELRAFKRALESGEMSASRPARESFASIAVLPFANRSAHADDEYFSDGLADELLGMLAKIKGLRVTARASSFWFKGKDVPLEEIGRALNVATLLDGSVRKSGDRLRISVQLVNAADSATLWSETYDRTLDDVFSVQDDIARAVVKELRATLLGEEADSRVSGVVRAEVSRAGRGRADHPEAHRLSLQARFLMERLTRADTSRAIGYLKEAIDLDPEHALAWAELSRAYAREADSGWLPIADGYGLAREAAARSLALEPDLAEGHAAMSWIQMSLDWDWDGAEASIRRAMALAPGNVAVLRRAGVLAAIQGRLDESIRIYHLALAQDPLSPPIYHNLGMELSAAGRHEEAVAMYRKALELAPQRSATRSFLSLSLMALGRAEEALAEAEAEPETAFRLWGLAIVQHGLSRPVASGEALRTLIGDHAEAAALQIAEVYAIRNEADPAFAWLERALAHRDSGLSHARANPQLASLRADLRWPGFLRRLGLEK